MPEAVHPAVEEALQRVKELERQKAAIPKQIEILENGIATEFARYQINRIGRPPEFKAQHVRIAKLQEKVRQIETTIALERSGMAALAERIKEQEARLPELWKLVEERILLLDQICYGPVSGVFALAELFRSLRGIQDELYSARRDVGQTFIRSYSGLPPETTETFSAACRSLPDELASEVRWLLEDPDVPADLKKTIERKVGPKVSLQVKKPGLTKASKREAARQQAEEARHKAIDLIVLRHNDPEWISAMDFEREQIRSHGIDGPEGQQRILEINQAADARVQARRLQIIEDDDVHTQTPQTRVQQFMIPEGELEEEPEPEVDTVAVRERKEAAESERLAFLAEHETQITAETERRRKEGVEEVT